MERDNIHIFEYLHLLRRRKVMVLASFLVVFVLVCLINLMQRPVYKTAVELMIDKDQAKIILGASVFAVDSLDDTYFLTQRRILRSTPIAQRVVQVASQDPSHLKMLMDCFRMSSPRKGAGLSEQQYAALVGRVQGALDLDAIPKTRIFHISAVGSERAGVAYLANTAAEIFVQNNTQSQLSNSQQAFLSFTTKLQELKDRLNISEFALQKIQLELKLIEMLKVYEDKHPEVIRIRSQIDNFSSYLKQQAVKLRQSLGDDQGTREEREGVLMSYLANDSARQGQGLESRKSLAMFLEQEVATNREMYNAFFKKFQEMDITDQRTNTTQMKILEPAGIPGRPSRPNKGLNLLFGCVAGITLGCGLAFFQDYLDNTIKTSEDIKKYLGLSILGIIPLAENDGKKLANYGMPQGGDPSHRLMTLSDSNSIVSEAYRTMRTNILLASVDRPLRTLLVTSSVQKEGKSTTAINLAVSIARSGSRILLVDADMRRPILAKTFAPDGHMKADLVDLLTDSTTLDNALYPSGVENLMILPCTKIPPNPSELLGSVKMQSLLESLKQRFDLVILDSPPLIAVTDAVALSAKMGGVVFVTSAGKVPRGICIQAMASLKAAKANTLGVVLNNVKLDQGSYNYYHYYRYYNSYTDTASSATGSTLAVR